MAENIDLRISEPVLDMGVRILEPVLEAVLEYSPISNMLAREAH